MSDVVVTMSFATAAGPTPLAIVDWGRTDYQRGWERQMELVARRLADEMADTLVLTEHDPVFTIGMRREAERHLTWSAERLAREGIGFVRTNRGGDITYHGPGQVVGYPIISLAARKDLHAYLRFLEQVLINALGAIGLAAGRRPGLTGIWVGRGKIAAIGVAVRRWVTYHGFALNVNPSLAAFQGIIPCGIGVADGTVTSIEAELGRPVAVAEIKLRLAREFAALLPEFLAGRDEPRLIPPAPSSQAGPGKSD